ncbi:Basic-leucine zipper transcription factor [Parasponia andersonii]|uniref:Basic-leucine zipper transcription factor n=1 Tax=Parasponia andersonii TaxID=3476 RepID=A0A2P5DMW3_PARAD|nr:Basic-leucine zipper transcription factor [Parasponia andersonii]
MIPGEFTGVYFLPVAPDQNPIPLPSFNNMITSSSNNNNILNHAFLLNTSFLTNNLPNYPQTTSSTSDEAEENYDYHHGGDHEEQMRIIDERRQRRMISNRESARRSRMRKQKHLDELWSQVVRLRNENHSLIGKLNHVSECHDRVLHENTRLKEEASDLRQMLTDLQIGSPYNAALLRAVTAADHHDHDVEPDDLHNHEMIIPCNAAHLRAETSSKNIATSVDLLH